MDMIKLLTCTVYQRPFLSYGTYKILDFAKNGSKTTNFYVKIEKCQGPDSAVYS